MNTIKFKKSEATYAISYDNLEIDDQGYVDADIIEITRNGEICTEFGENFAGHRYNGNDVFMSTLHAILNNDYSVNFEAVPEELQDLKSKYFRPVMTVNGRQVPANYYHDYSLKYSAGVQMITSKVCAYAGQDGSVALCDSKGALITDIEAFFTSGCLQSYKEDEIFFITPEHEEYMKIVEGETLTMSPTT